MIYCFDIDGTICFGEKETAIPRYERIIKINKLFDEGHIIIFETARGSTTGIYWYEFTFKQLNKWNVKFHQLRCGIKIHADIYVDDKGIQDQIFFE